MPFFPAPGTLRLAYIGKFGLTEEVVNILHVQKRNDAVFEPWTQLALTDALVRVAGALLRFMPALSTQVTYNELRARDLSSETGRIGLLPLAHQGTFAGGSMPPNVAYLVQHRTGRAGKGANGRTYLPGVLEGNVDNMGYLSAEQHSNLNGFADQFLNDLHAATGPTTPGSPLDLVVLHKATGVPLTRLATPVIDTRVSNLVATQRRRLPRRT